MSKCEDPGCVWTLGGTIHTDACYATIMDEYMRYKEEEANERFADMTPIRF